MSATTAISADDARRLMQEGYEYIDVRNELEFEQGHPAGAYNVPLMQMTDFGPEPNEHFVEVIKHHFRLDARLLVGCSIGVSSRKAASLLRDAGYAEVLEVKEGFNGCRDAFGRKSPGWLERGLPVEYGQPELRSFETLAEPIRK
jgi:rhodanese-related sulfurtransferase